MLLPTERSALRGVAMLRWGALAWSAVVGVVTFERLDRPWLATALLGAALAVTVAASVALTRDVVRSSRWWALDIELAVGAALLAGDPVAFDSLGGRQSSAGFWPLVGVIHAAIFLGPWAGGAVGLLVSLARAAGLLLDGTTVLTDPLLMSLLATTVFYGLAGAVAGWVAGLLRRAEQEIAGTRARDEVARTLHDGVLQTLAVVGRRTATADPELARLARNTDRDLRAFLFGAPEAVHSDLATALRAVGDRVAVAYDLPVTVSVLDDDLDPSPSEVQALAGAVGEALTNVAKHATASRAVVFAQDDGGRVFVSVRDDGVGFDPAAERTGEGLRRSVTARITELGGRVEIDTEVGTGTEVRLWL